eukprot:2344694-Amphidinium_carterae.2
MRVVNVIIFFAVIDTIVLLCVQGFVRDGFHESSKTNKETLLVALSILIAAVPVALPLVLQVRRGSQAVPFTKSLAVLSLAMTSLR